MNDNHTELVQARQEWARVLIRRGRALGPLPSFGDATWCRLPDADTRRIAAAVAAAESWARDGDDIERRIAAELRYERRALRILDEESFADLAAAVRAVPERMTIVERRRAADAFAPRPDDFAGNAQGGWQPWAHAPRAIAS